MIKKDEFYALLSAADLGVITPLRDGMNTTSMEFVIAQGETKRSPLVLSEFMGISSNMIEALQINPWNLDVRIFVLPQRICPFVDTPSVCRMWQQLCTVGCLCLKRRRTCGMPSSTASSRRTPRILGP